MPPHGPGCVGNMHSHDPQYPDDNWNLYAMLDPAGTTALNVTRPDQTIGIFKPHVHRLDPLPEVISDADEEIIIRAIFTSPVHIRKIMVIGGGEHSQHPSQLQCFVNHDDIDFTNVSSYNPVQQFNLSINEEGTTELITTLQNFMNVTSITFYFPSNFGDPNTILKYIGMQGEHTHYRREAVNTTYEVLCAGQDIVQPEEALGQSSLDPHSNNMH